MRAMRKAQGDAVLENLSFGLPIIQYRDKQIVEVPLDDLASQGCRGKRWNFVFYGRERTRDSVVRRMTARRQWR